MIASTHDKYRHFSWYYFSSFITVLRHNAALAMDLHRVEIDTATRGAAFQSSHELVDVFVLRSECGVQRVEVGGALLNEVDEVRVRCFDPHALLLLRQTARCLLGLLAK